MSLPSLLAGLPWIIALCAAWLAGGLALVRGALRLRGGVEVATLALPAGLLAHVLLVNALGHVLPLPWVLVATPLGLLAAWAACRGRCAPLVWELTPRARFMLGALGLALALGTYWLGAREVFPDDGCHGSLAGLFAAGHFPPRFPCNPALPVAYHYGGDLLTAALLLVPELGTWAAIDATRALVVTSVLLLAFLAGWRPKRSLRAGLLAVLLLVTVGQATWLMGPLLQAGPATWLRAQPGLLPLVDGLTRLQATPFGLHAPGNMPAFAHAQRSLAWPFGPFVVLLLLGLLEAPLARRRRSLALALVAGSASLLQSGVLPLAFATLGVQALLGAWRLPRVGARVRHVWGALALALVLAAVQGGPLRDGLLARLDGVSSPMTRLTYAPLQLPSCRGQAVTSSCAVLSLLNLGLAPWLLPWLAWSAWRARQDARLGLLAGALAGGAIPFLFRYEWQDYDVVRLLSYSLGTLGVRAAAPLDEALRAAGPRRWAAAAALPLLGFSGLAFLLGQAGVGHASDAFRARLTPALFGVGSLDEELRPLAARLPASALVFDPSGCPAWLAARPALVLGRYSASVDDVSRYEPPPPSFARLRVAPGADGLRAAGFTHAYFDGAWWFGLTPAARAAFEAGEFELLGLAGDARDFRALLRVCAAHDGCRLAPSAWSDAP